MLSDHIAAVEHATGATSPRALQGLIQEKNAAEREYNRLKSGQGHGVGAARAAAAIHQLEHGRGSNRIGWDEIETQLHRFGVKDSRIKDIHGMKPKERIQAVEREISKRTKQDQTSDVPQVQVKFTGAASKFFEQVKKPNADARTTARRGGEPIINTIAQTGGSGADYNELLTAMENQHGG